MVLRPQPGGVRKLASENAGRHKLQTKSIRKAGKQEGRQQLQTAVCVALLFFSYFPAFLIAFLCYFLCVLRGLCGELEFHLGRFLDFGGLRSVKLEELHLREMEQIADDVRRKTH